jgi:hypothetical protein
MDKIIKEELENALHELNVLQREYDTLYIIFKELCRHLRNNSLKEVEEFLEREKDDAKLVH